ncbi:MAG: hypothetical protein LBR58_03640 [Propionibacteriaceae bacterium]|jgi:hypothetical protein|nr:hypothetical protein [Propionibacteriaceae bacterium]
MSLAISVRLSDPIEKSAADYMASSGWSKSTLVNTALDEWLRTQAHPGIRFVSTPHGQRIAALAGGPEVWTVAESWLQHEPADRTVANVAAATGLTAREVECALAYWADNKAEIDADVERVHNAQRQAREAWERRQSLYA